MVDELEIWEPCLVLGDTLVAGVDEEPEDNVDVMDKVDGLVEIMAGVIVEGLIGRLLDELEPTVEANMELDAC